MHLHLFGGTTPTGEFFRQQVASAVPTWTLHAYSRSSADLPADFTKPSSFRPAGDSSASGIWISFGPIWHLAPFFEQLSCLHPERLAGLQGMVACSSSSAITKRYSINRYDRALVAKLNSSEKQLLATCSRMKVPCHILQPTLVYGKAGIYGDRNLSRLLQYLRRLPFFPLPAESGLRQPIHAAQLAAVALYVARQLDASGLNADFPERIALGGDTILSYVEMVRALQHSQPPGDAAHRCQLLKIPNRLFFAMATPLLLSSPRAFEAVLRMGSNLSGFTPAHQLLGCEPQPFPRFPLG